MSEPKTEVFYTTAEGMQDLLHDMERGEPGVPQWESAAEVRRFMSREKFTQPIFRVTIEEVPRP